MWKDFSEITSLPSMLDVASKSLREILRRIIRRDARGCVRLERHVHVVTPKICALDVWTLSERT